MVTALETLLCHVCEDPTLDPRADGPHLTAATRATYSNIADATVAAQELLQQLLNLGYRLRGGLVGAEKAAGDNDAGSWRGELVDVVLAEER